ncbi:MAG: hypothetical protein ACRD1U_11455, partial [Vicinamibacterales bacterium]
MSVAATVALVSALGAQSGPTGGLASIQAPSLREWLTYIASDELEGREVYTEGLGLAASYIADHLAGWGVKPGVSDGTYFQTVKVVGLRNNSRSTVTVEVNGEKRTFTDGEGVTFPRNSGKAQTIETSDVRFVGYGLQIPAADVDDYAGADVKEAAVVWLGGSGPATAGTISTRLLNARSRLAIEKGAAGAIGPQTTGGRGGRAGGTGAPAGRAQG